MWAGQYVATSLILCPSLPQPRCHKSDDEGKFGKGTVRGIYWSHPLDSQLRPRQNMMDVTSHMLVTQLNLTSCSTIILQATVTRRAHDVVRPVFTVYVVVYPMPTWCLVVWLSGNALASINVVALRQTRLVPGWVTVCGRVNHLGM